MKNKKICLSILALGLILTALNCGNSRLLPHEPARGDLLGYIYTENYNSGYASRRLMRLAATVTPPEGCVAVQGAQVSLTPKDFTLFGDDVDPIAAHVAVVFEYGDHPAASLPDAYRPEFGDRRPSLDLDQAHRIRKTTNRIPRLVVATVDHEHFVGHVPHLIQQSLEALFDVWTAVDRGDHHRNQRLAGSRGHTHETPAGPLPCPPRLA